MTTAQQAKRGRPRHSDTEPADVSITWTDCPVLNVPTAARLLGCSTTQIYSLAARGELDLVRVAGRVCARTAGVVKLVRDAEPWVSSGRNTAALAEIQRRAAARLAS